MEPALTTRPTGRAAAEVAGLKGAGMVSSLPLAAQTTSVTAIVAFHDVRWIQVYAAAWPYLAGEVVVTVTIRALMMGVLVRAAWPDRCPPSWRLLAPRCALAYLLALVAISPWGGGILSFAAGVSSLAYPVIAAIVFSLLTGILVIPHAGLGPRWWTRLASWRAMTWTALDFLAVTVAAIAIDYSPGWEVILTAAGAGLVNGWCWKHLVHACARPSVVRPSRRRLAVVPVGLAVAICGLPVGVASAVGVEGTPHTNAHTAAQAPPRHGQQVVLLVDGFGSRWNGAAPRKFTGTG